MRTFNGNTDSFHFGARTLSSAILNLEGTLLVLVNFDTEMTKQRKWPDKLT
mgnify:CR=1 FL=1